MIQRFRRAYGSSPLHLLSLLACFALAGFAVLSARSGPLPLRMAVWFLAAAVGHDLVLYPLYALADRSMTALFSRRRRKPSPMSINYLRVPLLLSAMLLLLFYPVIFRRSENTYGRASGLDESVYLGHWLLATGILFGGSAVLYAVAAARRAGSSRVIDAKAP